MQRKIVLRITQPVRIIYPVSPRSLRLYHPHRVVVGEPACANWERGFANMLFPRNAREEHGTLGESQSREGGSGERGGVVKAVVEFLQVEAVGLVFGEFDVLPDFFFGFHAYEGAVDFGGGDEEFGLSERAVVHGDLDRIVSGRESFGHRVTEVRRTDTE